MSTPPLNISSDDAAFFQASTSGQDSNSDAESDDDDTEDPVGRGASKIGQLDMFVPRPPKQQHLARGGTGQPQAFVNLTKGARIIPH